MRRCDVIGEGARGEVREPAKEKRKLVKPQEREWQEVELGESNHPTFTRGKMRRWWACINQQPPQHGGAIPDPVWVGSKWLLAFSAVPVTRVIP